MNFTLFDKVTFIGIGLIGSSLARSIKLKKMANEITVHDQNEQYMQRALEIGIADKSEKNICDAVKDADIVILSTPVGAYKEIAKQIKGSMKKGSILTDVGSVKSKVIEDVLPFVGKGVNFIPAHPVAGTEKSGPDSGFLELFHDRWCIVTPLEDTDEQSLKKVTSMWQYAGMKVENMDADHHDRVMAVVSHVPHLIAYSIVGTADDMEAQIKKEVIKYSAGGFRDFTRIAGSDPVMWRDIFLSNKEAVLEVLQRVTEDITALQRAIRWGEEDKLKDLFVRTRKIRHEVIGAGQHQMENMKTVIKK